MLVERTNDQSQLCPQVLLKYLDIKPIHCKMPVLQNLPKGGYLILLSPFLSGREFRNS